MRVIRGRQAKSLPHKRQGHATRIVLYGEEIRPRACATSDPSIDPPVDTEPLLWPIDSEGQADRPGTGPAEDCLSFHPFSGIYCTDQISPICQPARSVAIARPGLGLSPLFW